MFYTVIAGRRVRGSKLEHTFIQNGEVSPEKGVIGLLTFSFEIFDPIA